MGHALWTHPCVGEIYPAYLFRTHCIIRASVPLMEAALAAAQARAENDPVAAQLVPYFSKHIPEERHHDEWLLEDMEVLGMSREQVLQRLPPPSVAALVGSQFYWIRHVHPVALLGYIGVMEGDPPSVKFLEYLVRRTGLPQQAFRTLFKHAHLDPYHRKDFDQALDRLPLSDQHTALVGVSAFQTVHWLRVVFRELLETFPRRTGRVPSRVKTADRRGRSARR